MRFKRYTSKKAFTLVELLVVVSIIALLVSILMPSLNKARQQAKGVICLTNTRALGTAMLLYTSDYGDRFPQWYTYDQSGNALQGGPFWDDRLFPYVDKNFEVFLCPVVASSRQGREAIEWIKTNSNSFGDGGYSKTYRMNSVLAGYDSVTDEFSANTVSTGAVRGPSNVILIVDSDPKPFSYFYSRGLRSFDDLWPLHYPKFIDVQSSWTDPWGRAAMRGGSGFTFADGHGELISWEYSEDTWGYAPRLGLRIEPKLGVLPK